MRPCELLLFSFFSQFLLSRYLVASCEPLKRNGNARNCSLFSLLLYCNEIFVRFQFNFNRDDFQLNFCEQNQIKNNWIILILLIGNHSQKEKNDFFDATWQFFHYDYLLLYSIPLTKYNNNVANRILQHLVTINMRN